MKPRFRCRSLLLAFSLASAFADAHVNHAATLDQAGSTCTYILSSDGQSFSQAGGSGSFNLSAPTGCAWSVTSSAAWLTVTSSMSGTGPASVLLFGRAQQYAHHQSNRLSHHC